MNFRIPNLPFIFLLSYSLFFNWGCGGVSHEIHPPQENGIEEEDEMTGTEKVDSSCSYFYFLWATHAENNNRFNEAEEAYEKALICDPDSRYILRKLPILLIRMGKPLAAAQLLRTTIDKYPDELQAKLLLARLDIRNGETEEAIKIYNEIIKQTPEDETILLRLGFLYSEQNNFSEAEKIFNQALQINPESFFAHLYLARLAVQTGDYDQAGSWYKLALDLNWSVGLAIEVADFYGVLEEYDKVEHQYRSILKQHPQDTEAALGLVHTLLLQDKEEIALKELQTLRENSDTPNQIDIITARLYLRSGKIEKASEILESVALQENEPEAAYMLAVIHYQGGKTDKAMSLLRKIEQESSQYEDSIYLRVRILMETKQNKQAITLLEQTLANENTSTPGMYTLLASLFMEQGQLQKGYDILDTAIEEYPNNPTIYFEYGLLLEEEGRQAEAIESMEKVLELQPDHAEALNYIGYTWADMDINLEQALKYIQKAIELKPGNGYIQDSLGWVYFRMGDLASAKVELMRAIDLEPNDPNIHDHMGDVYLQQGDIEKAREAYQRAEELYPHQEQKNRIQEKLNALQ
ncbi:MAG: tetratricopeptide repeat protein [Desulfocapsa sp.]|nr:tetratricopeptide repeat protein [Desulfocapsa sp.]